ncbi:hypothetical protein PBR20603_04486 [Pandoraea bronchicola]|uniref:Uncharacterized protein n=2 Tax=Pandoraea bronchicola TaxID=2508287 RepID=A0A5E5BW06_9BURK|nr:hypothetical protein PBR20603_04486 [Pandoraea bronchicola]
MKLNRFDLAPTLNVVPDTEGGAYHFYDWQLVKFTATLQVPGGVADGRTIAFHSIGAAFSSDGREADFAFYRTVGVDADTTYDSVDGSFDVIARSVGSDRSVAVAEIIAMYVPVLDGSQPPESQWTGEFRASANTSVPTRFTSAYSGEDTSPSIPTEQNTFQLLPASGRNETPSTSEGNFFRWEVYVASRDAEGSPGGPLKNVCIRLYSDADYSFSGVRFFSNFEATEALPVMPLPPRSGIPGNFYVDIVTGVDGVASVFVCAANTGGTYAGRLFAKSGTLEQPCFNYVLPDFSGAEDSLLPGPSVASPLVVTPDDSGSLQCVVPSYDSAAIGDYLFLLCNKRMQQVDKSFVQRTDTGRQAMGFSKFGLHNKAYSSDRNELAYIVLPVKEPAKLSTTNAFFVKGDPGHVTLDAAGAAPAPSIVAGVSANGVVMNVESTMNGITVAVPVGEDNNPAVFGWGDKRFYLNVQATLVGWMDNSEALEVEGLQGSLTREISAAEIAQGYAYVWFPRIFLWGIGQSPEGSMGRCSIQYTISPQKHGKSVTSEVLVSFIDTLPPTGVGEYFETV